MITDDSDTTLLDFDHFRTRGVVLEEVLVLGPTKTHQRPFATVLNATLNEFLNAYPPNSARTT